MRRLLLPSAAVLSCAVLASLLGSHTPPATAGGLSCGAQTAKLRACGARTDNYKDCYNDGFPGAAEHRTWLAWFGLRAGGASYAPVAGHPQFSSSVSLRRTGGNRRMPARAYLTVQAPSRANVAFLSFRMGPPSQLWGPLLQLGDRTALTASPVALVLTLRRVNGMRLARATVNYRYDSALAGVGASSPEYNGPGGRWYVGARATRTDVELGTAHQCG